MISVARKLQRMKVENFGISFVDGRKIISLVEELQMGFVGELAYFPSHALSNYLCNPPYHSAFAFGNPPLPAGSVPFQ